MPCTPHYSKKVQSGALEQIVWELLVMSASTSGVEQNWSKMERVLPAQQKGSGISLKPDRLKIAIDYNPRERVQIIAGAQEAWSKYFGAPRRASATQRFDAGSSRAKSSSSNITDVGFVRKRRLAVHESLQRTDKVCSRRERHNNRLTCLHPVLFYCGACPARGVLLK